MTTSVRNGNKQPKGCWIRKERRLAIYIRDSFNCQYCGKDLRNVDSSQITLDHLTPRCQNGDNTSENLITACKSCNCGRQDKPYNEYATPGAIERIEQQRYVKLNIQLATDIVRGYVALEEYLR